MSQQGPIEDKALPERLPAHVVSAPREPRLHGYDVESDLARHYRFLDGAFLALTGELPSDDASRALEIVGLFALPTYVGRAPAHTAAVARVCGPKTSSMIAAAAIALAEDARVLLDEHESVLPKLVIGSLNGSAARLAARDDEERASVGRLRAALGGLVTLAPAIRYDVRLDTAIIAVLMGCGLRAREQIESMLVTLRLPAVCAEGLAWRPGDLRGYPMDLPRFEYEGDRK